jgi:hypothetical protein
VRRLASTEERSIDGSGRDGVNGDTTAAEILGKDTSDLLDGTL